MKKLLPYIIFAFISLSITLPFYRSGYIFLLDMVFPPQIVLADYLQHGINSSFPLILIIKALSFLIPVALIQKIILSLLLFLPGVFMYQLARQWERINLISYFQFPISILSGIFYLLNPYVYERFLAGHWLVLLGYAFFPLTLRYFLELLSAPTKKHFFKFTLLFSLLPIINLHWFYISGLFLVVLLMVNCFSQNGCLGSKTRNKKSDIISSPATSSSDDFGRGNLISNFLFLIPIFLVVNSFWLWGFFSPQTTFTQISFNDFLAFQTAGDHSFGIYFNVLALYGFWQSDYVLPKDMMQFWWLLSLIIFVLFILGVIASFKKRQPLYLTLAILFLPLLILSVGAGDPLTLPITKFFYHFLPGFKGLRETGKLIGLIAFSYAVFVPLGVQKIIQNLPKLKYPIYLLALLVPTLSVSSIFWGFSDQIRAHDYPVGWYQAEQILKSRDSVGHVLVLPWHGYPRLSFAGFKRISSPASRFFSSQTISGRAIDNVYLSETAQNDWDDKIFRLVQGLETLDSNIDFLHQQDVTHIILLREADYNRYGFLAQSTSLKEIFDTDSITVYEVE